MTMTTIEPERPDSADALTLIDELDADLDTLYPKTSRHGYSAEKIIEQRVAFFVTRQDRIPAGCGGVQFFGDAYGEIKRMYVRPAFRGLGLAKAMLNHLEQFSLERGIRLLRLETGIHQTAAIGLYASTGYRSISPFGDYQADPLSHFMEKRIE